MAGARILLLGGSLRSGSTNEAVLRTAQAVAPDGVTTDLYEGLATLPHFNPDDDYDPLDPAVVRLRAGIEAADAVLICTPEYAGALPGSFKNVLDWTIGGGEIYEQPVAWINASTSPMGAADAHGSLRNVLTYASTDIVEEACARIPVPRDRIGPDGLVEDEAIRGRITAVLRTLVEHAAGRSDPPAAS